MSNDAFSMDCFPAMTASSSRDTTTTIGLIPRYMRQRLEDARRAASAPPPPPSIATYMADAALRVDTLTQELRRRIFAVD
jgi:hypothetical protein